MNASDSQKILALIDAYVNDTADEQQQADLMAILLTDQHVRQLYLQYVDMHAMLKLSLKEQDQGNAPLDEELLIAESAFNQTGKNPASRANSLAAPNKSENSSGLPLPGNVFPLSTSENNNTGLTLFGFPSAFIFSLSFLVAATVIGGLLFWRAPAEPQNPNHSIAGVNSLFNPVSWKIETGSTTMDLDKIGHIVLEAAPGEPAEFMMVAPMRAKLMKGKIKVRITEETGHGFQVETPTSVVTDLGTEFLLNVSAKGGTDLAVIEGEVDYQVSNPTRIDKIDSMPAQRLVQGDGVKIDGEGNVDRIMTITRGNAATFHTAHELSEKLPAESLPLITSVRDNLDASDTKRFYEIVPGGFGEDAKAYVDRNYEWNGIDEQGIPKILSGADYIRMFNDDKWKDMNVTLTISRPATIYVLFDDRGPQPSWLKQDFKPTGYRVGMDEGPWVFQKQIKNPELGVGPGVSIDYKFSVWAQEVKQAGTIELGSRGPGQSNGRRSMYGIVVAPLEEQKPEEKKTL